MSVAQAVIQVIKEINTSMSFSLILFKIFSIMVITVKVAEAGLPLCVHCTQRSLDFLNMNVDFQGNEGILILPA